MINELTEEQRLRMRMVQSVREQFAYATGHWPKTIYASREFLRYFGISGLVGGLKIYGCSVLPIEGQLDNDHKLFCYANRAQLVD